jgi:hypothetical protein
MNASLPYELRYLAGIVLFNQHEFFEAHEVWESLWLDSCIGDDRRFIQGLIQAAVGLYHFTNRNVRGAIKLYRTARAYMEKYPSPHLGLDVKSFWNGMERCFAPLLGDANPPADAALDRELIPAIQLDPPPESWPDPTEFLDED